VGRLGRRVFGTTCARAISSFSRARASTRLASCVRCTRDVMINTPSCVTRLPANARRRCRTSAGSARDWPTSKRSWTAVETLLTFWPPGPEARTKVTVSSESGMNMGKCYFQNSPSWCVCFNPRQADCRKWLFRESRARKRRADRPSVASAGRWCVSRNAVFRQRPDSVAGYKRSSIGGEHRTSGLSARVECLLISQTGRCHCIKDL
jgi:hypothetical protein